MTYGLSNISEEHLYLLEKTDTDIWHWDEFVKFVSCCPLLGFPYVSILTYLTSSNIKYIDNQLVTVIKIQMICKCKYKTI